MRAEMDGDWCHIGPLLVTEEDWRDTFREEMPLPDPPMFVRLVAPNGKRLSAEVVSCCGFPRVRVVGSHLNSVSVSLFTWNKMVPKRYHMKNVGDRTEFWLSPKQ